MLDGWKSTCMCKAGWASDSILGLGPNNPPLFSFNLVFHFSYIIIFLDQVDLHFLTVMTWCESLITTVT